MAELTFISNKTRKESSKYFFVTIFAVITWILQISVFSKIQYFDNSPDLFLIVALFFGLMLGPLPGSIFGIVASFLSSSIFYDHIFYFSYPICGFLAGLLQKNPFSDQLLFFIILAILFTFPCEFINGWQYNMVNPIDFTPKYFSISFNEAVLNLFISPFVYFFMKFLIKKVNIESKGIFRN